MKTLELKGKKIAEVYVVKKTNCSCYDNSVIIKDNYEDAKAYYDKLHKNLQTAGALCGLSFKDNGTLFKLYNEEEERTEWMVSIHRHRFEITDKEI